MASITDPLVVTYSNDYLRPLSEAARNLQMMLSDAATEYTTIVQPILASFVDPDVLDDGRVAEGAFQVTKLDITNLLSHLNSVLSTLDTAGMDSLRAKFSIRPPKVRSE